MLRKNRAEISDWPPIREGKIDICKWLEISIKDVPLVPCSEWYKRISDSSIHSISLGTLIEELDNPMDFDYTYKEMIRVQDILFADFDVDGVKSQYPEQWGNELMGAIVFRSMMTEGGYNSEIIKNTRTLKKRISNVRNIPSRTEIITFLQDKKLDRPLFYHMKNRNNELNKECYEKAESDPQVEREKVGLLSHFHGYLITAFEFFPDQCLKYLDR